MIFTNSPTLEVIFICGPYKTGTSLLAFEIEKLGFFNPASESNRYEKGHGYYDNYYSTKECIYVRHINQNIIKKKGNRFRFIQSEMNFDIIEYLCSFNKPCVIKDPLFVYTLHIWLYNISLIGFKPKVYFTFRNNEELLRSWMHAYHTRGLFKENNAIIYKMKEKQFFQINYCSYYKIPFFLWTYSSNNFSNESKKIQPQNFFK
jgi:hypothetical protein